MTSLPRSFLWHRVDTIGTDHALLDDRRGLYARGAAVAADPVPFTCRYELVTDEAWATVRFDVSAEGAGWLRTARLERAAGRWRVTTAEQGDLDAALTAAGQARAGLPGAEDPDALADVLDVDLSASPLFNTLPVRRLGIANAPAGTEHEIAVAWVLVPSLAVVRARQLYTTLGNGAVRFASEGFTADIALDGEGYVERYPGLADRHGARRG
ncbi:MAG TPA: putative glycolipid-binding domain-containing protein [Pilimelia sp.]|nr:putative glycolipid-binding domain-containing protein [Pilimelia sp.]